MLYLLAIIFPPLAVLLAGKPMQALVNCVLCIFLWVPAVIHAFMVVKDSKTDKRFDRLAKAMQNKE